MAFAIVPTFAARLQSYSCNPTPCSGGSSSSLCTLPPAGLRPQQWRPSRRPAARLAPPVAAIKAVESYDGSFELEQGQQDILNELLYSDLFAQQVARDCRLPEGTAVEYTGVLFQPVPWTLATKKGMPLELEQQYHGKEEYTFINVPPVFMFQAKIFRPPRLCAIYRRLPSPEAVASAEDV